jgi:alkyl sulfatase BDS1-like metallo-beta-lactamase superfamily hydrolase
VTPTGPDLTPKPATAATRAAQAAARAALPPLDPAVEAAARRGFVAALDPPRVDHAVGGFPISDPATLAFLDGPAPDTVHPSLWENARLGAIHGLFRVADRVHQVRGYDLANVTVIEGDTGYVVVDSLTSTETAAAALGLVRRHLGDRPVSGVVVTHSHADHYGGLRALLDADALADGRQVLVAPAGFRAEVVSENVQLGNAMIRRSTYMFGSLLPRGPQGHVSAGIGPYLAVGVPSLLTPTHTIERTGQEIAIDGVRIVFHLTPGTEAPAEMNFHFPDLRVLCIAENASQSLHNLHTPRGAPVRDAAAWVRYLREAADRFADDSDALVACHHWPVWGSAAIRAHLEGQADAYQYVHDETLRLANQGYGMTEVGERVALPEALAAPWANREHYGTVVHNAKAVYQHYLGAFDGNPAGLHPHEPVAAAERYVRFMGGAERVLEQARASFAEGDYRWVAEVVNHVVFADPENVAARALQADALEQLGYQAVSAVWRDFYLSGASELRHGVLDGDGPPALGRDVVASLSAPMVFAHLAIRLDGPRAAGLATTLHVRLEDRDETWTVRLRHGVLVHEEGARGASDATVRGTLPGLVAVAFGAQYAPEAPAVVVEGDRAAWDDLVAALDAFRFWFPLVAPRDHRFGPPGV